MAHARRCRWVGPWDQYPAGVAANNGAVAHTGAAGSPSQHDSSGAARGRRYAFSRVGRRSPRCPRKQDEATLPMPLRRRRNGAHRVLASGPSDDGAGNRDGVDSNRARNASGLARTRLARSRRASQQRWLGHGRRRGPSQARGQRYQTRRLVRRRGPRGNRLRRASTDRVNPALVSAPDFAVRFALSANKHLHRRRVRSPGELVDPEA